MELRRAFSQKGGLRTQAEQMKFWKRILKPHVYIGLEKAVKKANEKLKPEDDGYKVVRGCDLDNWIANYENKYKPF